MSALGLDWSLAGEPAALALASLRVLALFTVAPVFGHASLSPRVRMAIGLGIALAVHPEGASELAASLPGSELGRAIVQEIAIGLALGFATRLIFSGVGLVGEIAGLQGGLGAAIALDPTSEASSGALAALLRAIAVLVFLAIDGHHALIRVANASFASLPLGGSALSSRGFFELFGLGAVMFRLGAQLAAPVMVAMFCANVGVGILGRALPQLNLITVQLPALIGLTFLLLGLGANELTHWLASALEGWPERVLATLAVES